MDQKSSAIKNILNHTALTSNSQPIPEASSSKSHDLNTWAAQTPFDMSISTEVPLSRTKPEKILLSPLFIEHNTDIIAINWVFKHKEAINLRLFNGICEKDGTEQLIKSQLMYPVTKSQLYRNSTDIRAIKWLHNKNYPFKSYLFGNNLNVPEFMNTEKLPLNIDTFTFAARHGNLMVMKWLKQQGCPWNTNVFAFAARHGNLNNMKWLLSVGCPYNSNTLNHAAIFGSFKNIKWLIDNKFEFGKYTFNNALYRISIDELSWIKDNGCSFDDPKIFINAIEGGDFELIKYLFDIGCIITPEALEYARKGGSQEIILWITQKLYPRAKL